MNLNETVSRQVKSSFRKEDTAAFEYVKSSGIDLYTLWLVVFQYKWWIIAIVFFTTLYSLYYAVSAEEVYRAEVLVSIVNENQSSSGLAASLGELSDIASIVSGGSFSSLQGNQSTVLAILESTTFMEKYIHSKNLLPVLFYDDWDSENNQWIEQPPTRAQIQRLVKDILFVSVEKKSNIVRLAVEWSDPILAAEWANDIVDRANIYIRDKAISEAENSIKYLRRQLENTHIVELKNVLFGLIAEQIKVITLAKVREQYVFNVIDAAIVPDRRIKPQKKLIVITGLLVGFGMAIIFVFCMAYIRIEMKNRLMFRKLFPKVIQGG